MQQLTICQGWLLRRRFQKVFSNLEISCYRKLGRGAHCIKDENEPLSQGILSIYYSALSFIKNVLWF